MLIRIVEEEIDEAEARRHVARPENGSVLLFHGVVRNRHEGRQVSHIDYRCYRAMAEKELGQIARDVGRLHGVSDLAVIHRIGPVAVGEASLLVAVGTPHRQAGFETASALVDELKKRVPIWKKEFGPDGAWWVAGVIPAADDEERASSPG